MTSNRYDFRQFQAELAALDGTKTSKEPASTAEHPAPASPSPKPKGKPARLGKKAQAAQRLALAREEFLALRDRHGLSVADVVAFFPEEEGIAYLQSLLAAAQAKPRRAAKPDRTRSND